MLTLFHAPQTRSRRIVRLLEELGVDYQIAYVEVRRRDGTGGADPSNPHPDAKVPALAHGETLVSESAAIAVYLTDAFPDAAMGAPVGSPERGAYLTWIAWAAGELEPSLFAKMSGETANNPFMAARLEAAMDRLLTALRAGPWIMGEEFSAADVMVGGAIAWARPHLPESELIDSYLQRFNARPAAATAEAKDAPPSQVKAA